MMTDLFYYIGCAVLVAGVLAGIAMMSRVRLAAAGNLLCALCMAAAIILTLIQYDIMSEGYLWAAMAAGLVCGLIWAARIKMMEMPQVVALLNSFGGAASAAVTAISLLDGYEVNAFGLITGGLALAIGTVTLTGSLVAAGKLHKLLPQKAVVWRGQQAVIIGSILAMGASALLLALRAVPLPVSVILCVFFSAVFGIAFSIRVGGADMPITISLLNSLSGVAGSVAGMVVGDPLLVAVGGVVGASGLLLTQIMCKSMNRRLADILTGKTALPLLPVREAQAAAGSGDAPPPGRDASPDHAQGKASGIPQTPKRVIIIPGYGMALAQAQQLVKRLADKYEAMGAKVDYAIHPVAGRMPGHMNVLLAEADVPYDKLREMDDINPEFDDCDLAVVVGANDVVNPAANTAEGTPIYGMPVLNVQNARHILVCNYDSKPGYAGVDNPLYHMEHVTLMLGDAAETLKKLL